MSLIDHPTIIRAHCSFVVDRCLWVVMPFMGGGSCLHIMKSAYPNGLEEPIISKVLKQTLKALDYLHCQGHIHRDVKTPSSTTHCNLPPPLAGSIKLCQFMRAPRLACSPFLVPGDSHSMITHRHLKHQPSPFAIQKHSNNPTISLSVAKAIHGYRNFDYHLIVASDMPLANMWQSTGLTQLIYGSMFQSSEVSISAVIPTRASFWPRHKLQFDMKQPEIRLESLMPHSVEDAKFNNSLFASFLQYTQCICNDLSQTISRSKAASLPAQGTPRRLFQLSKLRFSAKSLAASYNIYASYALSSFRKPLKAIFCNLQVQSLP
eukprot:Gb_16548 [translate_table: standard]